MALYLVDLSCPYCLIVLLVVILVCSGPMLLRRGRSTRAMRKNVLSRGVPYQQYALQPRALICAQQEMRNSFLANANGRRPNLDCTIGSNNVYVDAPVGNIGGDFIGDRGRGRGRGRGRVVGAGGVQGDSGGRARGLGRGAGGGRGRGRARGRGGGRIPPHGGRFRRWVSGSIGRACW